MSTENKNKDSNEKEILSRHVATDRQEQRKEMGVDWSANKAYTT